MPVGRSLWYYSDMDEKSDRPLIIIKVRRLGEPSKDQDLERRPTLGVGDMVNADYLVGVDNDSNERYKDKILCSLREFNQQDRTATIVTGAQVLTIKEGVPTRLKSDLYGDFEVTLLEFTSRSKLHAEAVI
jgi:hypothetical protein